MINSSIASKTKLNPEKLQKPQLNRFDEEKAYQFLAKNRGRPSEKFAKRISQIARKLPNNDKSKNAQRLTQIFCNWPEIIGQELAAFCVPIEIKGHILCIKANGAAASLIQMRSQEILRFASLAIGHELLRLNIIQGKLATITPKTIKENEISFITDEKLDILLDKIRSDDLRNAIRKFSALIDKQSQ